MIKIDGLSSKQQALCEILWGLGEYNAVQAFVSALPQAERRECETLIQMMIMSFVDEITEVDQAQSVLKRFTLKS